MFRMFCTCLVISALTACSTTAPSRHRQIESIKTTLSQSTNPKEQSSLLFRQGLLYWEEAKSYLVAASQKDIQIREDMRLGDTEAQHRVDAAKTAKTEFLARAEQNRKLAIDQYTKVVMNHPDFERSDEALFFLGTLLMEDEQDRKALLVFRQLLGKYPGSRRVPDTFFALGEYLFNNAKGNPSELEKALSAYQRAVEVTDSQVHLLALYKQGWCFFKLGDYSNAKDRWKTVSRMGEQTNASEGKKIMREARVNYVRAYARDGDVSQAEEDFSNVAAQPEARFTMMKQLADLYSQQGKEREAVFTRSVLLQKQPPSAEPPAALQTKPPRDKATIGAVIKTHDPEMRGCYEVASIRYPELAGKVVVKFTIQAQGFVGPTEIVQSTVRNAELESCIDEYVKSFSFAEASKPTVVTYPFAFVAGGASQGLPEELRSEEQPAR